MHAVTLGIIGLHCIQRICECKLIISRNTSRSIFLRLYGFIIGHFSTVLHHHSAHYRHVLYLTLSVPMLHGSKQSASKSTACFRLRVRSQSVKGSRLKVALTRTLSMLKVDPLSSNCARTLSGRHSACGRRWDSKG